MSLKRSDSGSPWSLCRRPWTVMYITANGRALPCCIAPFSQRGYENYTLGDATQQTLREIWTGAAYRDFRSGAACRTSRRRPAPAAACAGACSDAATLAPEDGVAVVIPTFNEAESIGAVVAELPRDIVGTDHRRRRRQHRRHAGLRAPRRRRGVDVGRGYGRACLAGAQAADGADIVVFMDGDGADDPAAIAAHGRGDPVRRLSISSSARAPAASANRAAWRAIRFSPGSLAGALIRLLYGVRYTDMCAFRAIRRDTLLALGMREMTYGWNLEMQMRAARAGLRVLELPVAYRCRTGGESKVAGSLSGSIRAGLRIIATFARVALEHDPEKWMPVFRKDRAPSKS